MSGDGLVHEVFNGMALVKEIKNCPIINCLKAIDNVFFQRRDASSCLASVPIGMFPTGSGNALSKNVAKITVRTNESSINA